MLLPPVVEMGDLDRRMLPALLDRTSLGDSSASVLGVRSIDRLTIVG